MSRSSHLDHPGCGSSLCSLSRLLSSAPGPASTTPLCGAQQQLCSGLSSPLATSGASLIPRFFFFLASLFLALSASFALFFGYPLHNTLPLDWACAQKTLKETAPRDFPTQGWKSFWVWKLWFEHASGCSFYHMCKSETYNISLYKMQKTRH